ncbi:hypothetical protein CN200_24700 [Sinorhizobium meliloti]|uniref:hypothetical protein n=1 Tax=Rhizobium meliloti TaxID=382 RepID=UPI000FD4E5CB|nr:hypothetical protein [Sinorhizobium meliloti]RVI11976.1 hypothetical protein CN200_24700 [Sinorhizobium meliloti]RVN79987.1 hypothetical protein CN107_29755 [Sinorhizobium meliloti]RVO11727.1 hypothetical protein CN103_12900 [Sinorhizobium meliloti]
MLSEQRQAVLVGLVSGLLQRLNAINFIDGLRGAGTWVAIVPVAGATYINELQAVVRTANAENWLRQMVVALMARFPARAELAALLVEIDRNIVVPTSQNAVDEVLLGSGRPFVNRSDLRAHLLAMTSVDGAPILLIDGAAKTGKSYSFYLINHVAPTRGFETHKFSLATCLRPNELAAEILERIGATADLPPIGNESAERWAGKLATIIYNKLKGGPPRVLVFDDFPVTHLPDGSLLDVPLPDGTASFLIRLAKYADEELHDELRIVFTRFRAPLPAELEDVALRDEAQGFTKDHMVGAIMQVVAARKWSVSPAIIQQKVDDFHSTSARTLNDCFRFVRDLLRELAK